MELSEVNCCARCIYHDEGEGHTCAKRGNPRSPDPSQYDFDSPEWAEAYRLYFEELKRASVKPFNICDLFVGLERGQKKMPKNMRGTCDEEPSRS